MAEEAHLDIEKTYAAVLNAARDERFIAYGDLAAANGVRWQKVRRQVPQQLGQLVTIAHERGWPLLSAIVVNKENLKNGLIEGTEPPRVCRRLQLLRRWSHHEQDDEQVLPGSAPACGAAGSGSRA